MKEPYFKRYSILLAVILFCAALIAALTFAIPKTAKAPCDYSLSGTDGESVASISITDLQQLNALTCVNYTPDEFLIPGSQKQGTPVDLTQNNKFAKRGTFVFIIRNIDPMSPDFLAQSEELTPYLQGDGYWHFTLYIPHVWSACNVYIRSALVERTGEISDYNFINYTEYVYETKTHTDSTEPLFLDLNFYPKQQAITPDALLAATVVTIHYEARSVKGAGMEGIPLIGSDEAVRGAVARDKTLLIILFVLAALISAIFVFVCFLKKTASFLPHLGIVFGIFGIVFSSYVLTEATSFPYLWKFVRTLMCALTMLSAFYALRNKKTPFKVWLAFAVLFHAFCLSVPLLQLLPFDASAWLGFYSLVVTLICSCAIVISVLVYAKQKEVDVIYLINSLLVGITGISLCLPDVNLFAAFSPALWMCAIIIAYTAYLGLCVFIRQEKRLNYLTKNLQSEVQIRTKEMKTMLEERDNLLRFISHDMKKPAASIEHYLGVLRQKEQDSELCKTIDIISRKTNELNRSFTDLSSYAKNSFAAEESRIFDLNELLVRTQEDFEPDCTANGICLKTIPCKISVYAQYNNLYSVIGNIVLNAIEHSECKNILIAAMKKKGVCMLSIADDGKGIDESKDVFMPYYSEAVSENNTGIGLYISRNFMRSMNGELTYRQEDGKLEFLITLPLA